MTPDFQALCCGDRRLLRVIRHVAQDLSRQPHLAELARIACLERTYFCRHFQQRLGVSFSFWNRHVRAERAKALLASTDLPITTIAAAVGYRDVTTFERNFRKCVDTSPRQYRQTARTDLLQNTILAENSTTKAETARDVEAYLA